jgi:2-aminoadipate transaminase
MALSFSDRITDVPQSFIREILKTTLDETVISFAGGLPNRDLFPVNEIKDAAIKVLEYNGKEALQYSTSEGYLPLREWIANRYSKLMDITVDPQNIIITSGSQQGLDLLGKVLINDNDSVAIEEPGYLGAIQAFSLYRPSFHPVPIDFDGLNLPILKEVIGNNKVKIIYTVPNFQNPSGLSHTDKNRDGAAEILRDTDTLLIEDNPYGELQFSGTQKRSYYSRIPKQTVLLGSFSKVFAPSLRLGWIVTPPDLTQKVIIAKQASDLHTNYLSQRILYQFLLDNSIDEHIKKIRLKYKIQKETMLNAITSFFPKNVTCSNPDGGMFLWAILPENISAKSLFAKAVEQKVVYVPGDPFYINKTDVNTMRLNFSCAEKSTIETGIKILGSVIQSAIDQGLS